MEGEGDRGGNLNRRSPAVVAAGPETAEGKSRQRGLLDRPLVVAGALALVFAAGALSGDVVITEIHYAPADKTVPEEFVELFNPGPADVELAGWKFTRGIDYTFSAGTVLKAREYLVVARSPSLLRARWRDLHVVGPFLGRLSNTGERLELRDASARIVDELSYRNRFPWPIVDRRAPTSIELIHARLDNAQGGSWRRSGSVGERGAGIAAGSLRATPGKRNSVHSESAPIHVREVKSEPRQPRSGQDVTISVRVTSATGIASVRLEYQIVEPGSYFGLGDREYAKSWLSLPMRDGGAGDSTHEVVLPGSVQRHRRLVRYRLVVEGDSGELIRAPAPDDPEPNFAYFVHDGIPAWKGAVRPGSSDPALARVVSHGSGALGRLPVYHLLTRKSATEDATWRSGYRGSEFRWRGTLVYDGEVYDHIGYRARGGVWRYSMGKNMWKFDFPRSHRFRARDNWGRRYRERWDKLNLSAVIQQADWQCRGEQGLFESVTYRLFNLAGVAAPKTHFVHLRIVDEAEEAGPTQYDGDFWGLYLAIEQMDGRFLDEHDLPDGNLYKIDRPRNDRNNLAPGGPADGSDVREFLAGYLAGTRDDAWWRRNFDLDGYYRYRAVVEAVHHYDIGMGKNYFYFHNPLTERWSVLPWDVDLTWADHMFGSGRDPFYFRVLARPAFMLEYRNRVRDVRDLLFNSEQAGRLIDEYAAMIDEPSGKPSMVDADRALWDYHPVMSDWSRVDPQKARPGMFYRISPTGDFAGMVRLMKNYVEHRGRLLDRIALDPAIPQTPRVTCIGPAGHPADALRFRMSPFADPQGDDTFAALQWRVAEITPDGSPSFQAARPGRYEAESIWESGTMDSPAREVLLPREVATPGKTYRVRVRVMDVTNRWSHWSSPIEFVAGERRG